MSRPAYRIRRGTLADAEALAALAARTFEETYARYNTPEDMAAHLAASFVPDKQTAELVSPDFVTVLAEVGGAFAGFAQVRRARAPECVEDPRTVELWRFYVDRPWQGRGLAAPLMEAVRQGARDLGGGSVWLGVWTENRRAVRFYEKCGFRIIGSQTFLLGSDEQSDHVMVMPL